MFVPIYTACKYLIYRRFQMGTEETDVLQLYLFTCIGVIIQRLRLFYIEI